MEEEAKKQINISYPFLIFLVLLLLIAVVIYFGFRSSKEISKKTPSPSPQSELNFASPSQEVITSDKEVANNMEEITELKIEDIKVGEGAEADAGMKVTVNYIGTLLNGQQFDSSYERGTPFSFNLGVGEVIPGWDQGIVGMKVGGKRKLIIPPHLAYGERGSGEVVPPNAVLIFEVELLGVE